MILHDPLSRAEVLRDQGGRCALTGEPLGEDHSFLLRMGGVNCVVGWAAALAIAPEVQEEVGTSEFSDLFELVEVAWREPLDPRWSQNAKENDPEFFRQASDLMPFWPTLFPIACWLVATDSNASWDWRELAVYSLAGVADWVRRNPARNGSLNKRVWLPGRQMYRIRRPPAGMIHVDVKRHQLLGIAPLSHWTWSDACGVNECRIVQMAFEMEASTWIFQPNRWLQLWHAPLASELPPFAPSELDTSRWNIVDCLARWDLAERGGKELAEVVFDHVMDTALAHQVVEREARSLGACVARAAVNVALAKQSNLLRQVLNETPELEEVDLDQVSHWASMITAGLNATRLST